MTNGPGPEAAKQAQIMMFPPPLLYRWDDALMLANSALFASYKALTILLKQFNFFHQFTKHLAALWLAKVLFFLFF